MVETKTVVVSGNSSRPLGVAVIAVVVVAFGIITALLGLLGMLTGMVTGIMDAPRGSGREFLSGFIGLVLGLVYVFAGLGLWALRPWAWWLSILVGIVGFVIAFGSPLWMVLWAGLVVYLFLVRSNFGTLRTVRRVTA